MNSTGAPKFKTSNKKIATVDTAGVITAVKAGNCKVTATVGKHVYTCRVTVKNAYSTQSLKKNFTLSANTTNGIVKFKIVNKYNHPMYIEIIGKEVKADGSNTGVSTNYNVPAKSTIYRYLRIGSARDARFTSVVISIIQHLSIWVVLCLQICTPTLYFIRAVSQLPLQPSIDLIFQKKVPAQGQFRWITRKWTNCRTGMVHMIPIRLFRIKNHYCESNSRGLRTAFMY